MVYNRDGQDWWAEAPEVPGFVVGAVSLEETRQRVREGLPFFLEVEGSDLELDERVPTVVS